MTDGGLAPRHPLAGADKPTPTSPLNNHAASRNKHPPSTINPDHHPVPYRHHPPTKIGEVGRWLLDRREVRTGSVPPVSRAGACSVSPWRSSGQRPPIEPCVPFSGTRLSDIVHRRACAAG
jgi:hypothetical protein